MKVGYVLALFEPFRLVCDPHSLEPKYRMVLVEPKQVSASTAKAAMVSQYALNIDQPFALEVANLYSVAASLPPDAELEFELQDSVLNWSCGRSRGRLATKPPFTVDPLPEMPKDDIDCSQTLSTLFQFGALSCSNQALSTIGLYGMSVVPDGDHLWCFSSDNVTIAAARMATPKGLTLKDTMTVGAPETALLASLAARTKSFMAFTPKAIFFQDADYDAVIHLVKPLNHNLYDLATKYLADDAVHDINKERVQAFVKRATFLAETRQNAIVIVHAEGESLTLEFNEQLAQTEEHYPITEGFKVNEPVSVAVDAVKLAKALANCDQLLLDNMDKHVIVFRAKNSSFHYIISGHS
jgi:hypothetical protein